MVARGQAARNAADSRVEDELVAHPREAGETPGQPVVIAADKSARYEDVIGVLDLLQRNGAQKVGLLARPAN
jgi:biopolymer transport protein TolR